MSSLGIFSFCTGGNRLNFSGPLGYIDVRPPFVISCKNGMWVYLALPVVVSEAKEYSRLFLK
jgi:hypothetical protein